MNELWCEKYRPKTIDDCILTEELKTTFKKFVEKDYVPNLILSGGPGVGKTTVARAMLEECDFDYIIINGSLDSSITRLRTDILQYASTVSFSNKRKYVILDEADYMSAQHIQPALRNFIEEFSENCGFILTCNYKNRIIEPLHSRCSVVEFNIPNSEKPRLATGFMKRVEKILKEQNVTYSKKTVAEFIKKHFPDWRRIINELQRHGASGRIDETILINFQDQNFDALAELLRNSDFEGVRKWVGSNSDIEPSVIYRKLYDTSSTIMVPTSIPQLILHLADYGYKSAFVADQEINLVACLTEIMADCEFVK